MFTLAAFVLILTPQAQPTVRQNVEQRGLRADAALSSIGGMFGVELTADKSTREDVLVVYLPGVTFEEFRSKSADGWNATWRETKTGWELFRSEEQVQSEHDLYLKERAEALKAQLLRIEPYPLFTERELEELTDELRSPDNEFIEAARNQRGSSVNLGSRAIRDLLSEVDPSLLASLKYGEARTFSTLKDRTFPSLPALDRAYRKYDRDRLRLLDSLEKAGILSDLRESVGSGESGGFLETVLGISENPGVFVLKIVSWGEVVVAGIRAFDDSGVEYFSVAEQFRASAMPTNSLMSYVAGDKLVLSDRAHRVMQAFANAFSSSSEVPVDPILAEIWSNMPQDDPLSYAVSEAIIELGKRAKVGVVGRLNDRLLAGYFMAGLEPVLSESRPNRIDFVAYLRRISVFHRIEVPPNDAPIVVSPLVDPRARVSYPRDIVSAYAKRFAGSRSVDIDRLAELITGDIGAAHSSLWEGLRAVLSIHTNSGELNLESIPAELLAAFQSLSPDAKREARTAKGAVIRYDQTTPQFQEMIRIKLATSIYWNSALSLLGLKSIIDKRVFDDLISVSLPNGPPPDTQVRVTVRDRAHAYRSYELGPAMNESMDFAGSMYAYRLENNPDAAARTLRVNRYRIGTSFEISLEISLAGNDLSDHTTIYTDLGPRESYLLRELPPEFRRQFWDAVEKADDRH